jgi:FkbM family methyltransferase
MATSDVLPKPEVRAKKSYAQNGEDLLIDMLLGHKRPISYVDVGCLFPDLHSNTYLHYLAGGRGVCIDPNPDVAERFRAVRPHDKFVNAGVSDVAQKLKYYMHRNPVFNTFSKARAKQVQRRALEQGSAGRELIAKKKIRVRPLLGILRSVGMDQGFLDNLDLLSVDVEGHELEVMNGIDFTRLRPKLIVAEAILERGSFVDVLQIDFVRRLSEFGYRVRAYTGHDVYLMRSR